jgi:hypothetical protein
MTRHVRRELQLLLSELSVTSILDVPCGDFNWMQHMDLAGISYIGGDIVPPLIEKNRLTHARPNVRFELMDVVASPLPRVDLVLCRDCFIHLPFAMIHAALANIRRSGSQWLLMTSFPWRAAGPNVDIEIGSFHRLNFELPPFNLPPPVRTIPEGFHPEMTQDKSLVLYRVADLPA